MRPLKAVAATCVARPTPHGDDMTHIPTFFRPGPWRAAVAALLPAGVVGAAAAGLPRAQPAPAPVPVPAPSAERQTALVRMVRQDCGSCHGMRLTGLGPAITPQALEGKPLLSMASTIYGGRPGTPCRAGAPCSPSKKPTGWPSSWPRAFLKNPGDLRDEPTRLPALQRRGLLTLMASAPCGQWLRRPGRWPRCGSITSHPGGTGDLGVVIQRAQGRRHVVNTSDRSLLGEITGLGDLSHASVVFSRDGRYAYVFGRDGGLTQVDLLRERIVHRVMQAGNLDWRGAVSADGTLVAAQNYVPGGVKVFDAKTLGAVGRPARHLRQRAALARRRPGGFAPAPLRLQPVRCRCDLHRRLL